MDFPSAVQFVQTIARMLREDELALKLLSIAEATEEVTDYDNWNGGTTLHTLYLRVPPEELPSEEQCSGVEERILRAGQRILRPYSGVGLAAVVISPSLASEGSGMPVPIAVQEQAAHLWDAGFLRLFISHISRYKTEMGALRVELKQFGVSGFVAHENIKPSRKWAEEIRLALQTCDALAAVITGPEFHQSDWTDQEIGFALGRDVLVLPVRTPTDPYGLFGSVQGLKGHLDNAYATAGDIVRTLLSNEKTEHRMRECLVIGLENAANQRIADSISKAIKITRGFTNDQMGRMLATIEANPNVQSCLEARERLEKYVSSHGYQPPLPAPSPDEYDPFADE